MDAKTENDQSGLELIDQINTDVERYEFEPIKGYPMLRWRGKRPFTSTQYYPAQLKEVHGEEINGWRNKIYWGDNLQVMSHLLKEFRGKVDLVYIDPPFDSKADYKKKISLRGRSIISNSSTFEDKQYIDIWSNDDYLQFIYERLCLIRELLSDTGTLFLHLDPSKVHYIKVICDEIFGEQNFRNEIIWRCSNSHNSATKQFGPIHQNILFYSKTDNYKLEPLKRPLTAGYVRDRFKYEDKNGIYQPNYLTGPGLRSGESGQTWNGFNPSSKGRHWSVPSSLKKFLPDNGKNMGTHEMLDALKKLDLLVIPKKLGGQPMYKQYITEGTQYQDLWVYQPNTNGVLHNSEECIDEDIKWLDQENEINGYPTQKPEGILNRIIQSCTNPDSLVFDCFMGSGTTQAAAMKLGRKFIGCDINLGAIQITTKRLLTIASGIDHHRTNNGTLLEVSEHEMYTGFEVYNVNHYDIFRNPAEARDLLLEALEVNVMEKGAVWDGEKDNWMIKLMPVNRIATKADLNEIITGVDWKAYERKSQENPNRPVEKIRLVCMGHEPDLAAELEYQLKPNRVEVEVLDILRDKSNLEFKRDAQARIVVKKGKLVIEKFYPMNLMQKLSLQKEEVTDWREMTENIMIDWNYDGAIFNPTTVDIPEKNAMVVGEYKVPEDAGTIRVKITDLLSESWEGNIHGEN